MPTILTEKEMCGYLSVCRQTLKAYRENGMPCLMFGPKTIRYDLYSVLDWVKFRNKKEVKK
jgi:hypothetical protein